MRQETDSLGSREVPRDALYGIHTVRALENFGETGPAVAWPLIQAMAQVKLAAARTNEELGFLAPDCAEAIRSACREVIDGVHCDEFVLHALQGGAGTSLNMNLNEVIANRAEELLGGARGAYRRVQPIDHVNLHQSTNDVFPTALKIAAIVEIRRLEKAVSALQTALQQKEQAFADILKVGRTQLQDACPMTLGGSLSAWAEALGRDRWRLSKCEERLRVVNLGGTAIGTGLTAPRDYIFRVVERLREETRLGLARAENLIDATQNADVFVEVSGILKAHAVNLLKISADLRLLASGPRAGLGELRLPAVQVGSSIMPGKVNPVMAEALSQAAMLTIGHDAALTLAAQAGQLELNAFLPLIAHCLLESLAVLTAAIDNFRRRAIDGLMANAERCREHFEHSWTSITALVPVIGYAAAAKLAQEAEASGRPVRELILAQGLLSAEELEQRFSPAALTALGYRR